MKDELKEILDYIDDRIIPNEKWNKVKDHINNLQKYYNDIVNKYEEILVKYSDLRKENKKNIEYIKELRDDLRNCHIENNKLINYKSRNKKAVEKLESISIYCLRSGKTLLSTWISVAIDMLEGE